MSSRKVGQHHRASASSSVPKPWQQVPVQKRKCGWSYLMTQILFGKGPRPAICPGKSLSLCYGHNLSADPGVKLLGIRCVWPPAVRRISSKENREPQKNPRFTYEEAAQKQHSGKKMELYVGKDLLTEKSSKGTWAHLGKALKSCGCIGAATTGPRRAAWRLGHLGKALGSRRLPG